MSKLVAEKQLRLAGLEVRVQFKSPQKNLYLKVLPPKGEILVSSPLGLSMAKIKELILKHYEDLVRRQARLKAQHQALEKHYRPGETHYLWGQPYRLAYANLSSDLVTKTNKELVLGLAQEASSEEKELALREFYRQEMQELLPELVREAELRTGLKAREYRLRQMKTRWGSINLQAQRIWLSLELAKRPYECTEYVLVHELCHLREKAHNARFHALVQKFYPQWEESERLLQATWG